MLRKFIGYFASPLRGALLVGLLYTIVWWGLAFLPIQESGALGLYVLFPFHCLAMLVGAVSYSVFGVEGNLSIIQAFCLNLVMNMSFTALMLKVILSLRRKRQAHKSERL